MNIIVIGAGYVGLVTGACFSELGNHVTCVDVNPNKINQLKNGKLPLFEPGLETMVSANIESQRLKFAHSLQEITYQPDVIFIAVGTPAHKNGYADVQYVQEAARDIGKFINDYCVIVDKSTVPVGMADQVSVLIEEELKKRQCQVSFDVVSNPEFLREGAAIEDFMHPDRVIIGTSSAKRSQDIMVDLYLPLLRNKERIYFMSVKDAEMTKYAANAMLAARISFMNEIALLCEKMDVDIEKVRIGIGSDARIGPAFLNAGCGYGGSCFPKDVRALIKMAEEHAIDPLVLHAVEARNQAQKQILSNKLTRIFGTDLSDHTIAVWGLSFKPETDDMREASSMVLIESIIKRGGKVHAYDPVAMLQAAEMVSASWLKSGAMKFVSHQYQALEGADALVLVTEWKSFCYPDWALVKKIMKQPIIIDGRNQYDPQSIKNAGFQYDGIGRRKEDNCLKNLNKAVA